MVLCFSKYQIIGFSLISFLFLNQICNATEKILVFLKDQVDTTLIVHVSQLGADLLVSFPLLFSCLFIFFFFTFSF